MSNGYTTRSPPSAGRRLEQVIYTEPIATSVSRFRSRKNSSKQPLHHRSLRHIYRMTLTTPTTPYTKEAATNSSVYDVKPTRYVNFTPCLVEGETTGIHRQQTRTTTQHLQQSLCVDGEDPRLENPGGEVPMCLIDYIHLLLENNHIDGENPRIMEKPFRRRRTPAAARSYQGDDDLGDPWKDCGNFLRDMYLYDHSLNFIYLSKPSDF